MFEQFIRDLPDGTYWPTGKWLKGLIRVLESDRARLYENAGTEIPTSKGRFFQVGGAVAAAELKGFELIAETDESGSRIRVVRSLLAGGVPTGFSDGDDPPYILTVGASGVVYGVVTISETTGAVTSRTLGSASSLPGGSSTSFVVRIGSFSHSSDGALLATNDQYGPIGMTFIRDWSKGPGESGRWALI